MTPSLSQRIATMVQLGHHFEYDLSYRPESCLSSRECRACSRQTATLGELLVPATRGATLRLLAQARRYQYWLIRSGLLIDRAIWYQRGDHERARQHRARLEDTLGLALVDQVRRVTGRLYGDQHGRCLGALLGWCACGQITYAAPWAPEGHEA